MMPRHDDVSNTWVVTPQQLNRHQPTSTDAEHQNLVLRFPTITPPSTEYSSMMRNNNSTEENKNITNSLTTEAPVSQSYIRPPSGSGSSFCETPTSSPESRDQVEESYSGEVSSYAYRPPSAFRETASPMDLAGPSKVQRDEDTHDEHDDYEAAMDIAESSDDDEETTTGDANREPITFPWECPMCEFTAMTHDELDKHLQFHVNMRLQQAAANDAAPASSRSKVKRSRKPKSWYCKACHCAFTTRDEYWAHREAHFKPGKRLQCPKCRFCTPFKHHLEYHIANHLGIKPFRCDKCSYACVSKSMLNSHLKSHSSIYQFHCGDCPYKTKYCHSFKLHLRKQNHNVGVVLHPDGTPNQSFVLDVYGTRRGPKRKSTDQNNSQNAGQELAVNMYPTPQASPENLPSPNPEPSLPKPSNVVATPQSSPNPSVPPTIAPILPLNGLVGFNPIAILNAVAGPNGMHFVMNYSFEQLVMARFPLDQLGIHGDHHLESFRTCLMAQYNQAIAMNAERERMMAASVNSGPIAAAAAAATDVDPSDLSQARPSNSNLGAIPKANIPATVTNINARVLAARRPSLVITEVATQNNSTGPLDLTTSDNCHRTPEASTVALKAIEKLSISDSENELSPSVRGKVKSAAGTSRRKGRAVKLVRQNIKEEVKSEDDTDTRNNSQDVIMPESPPESTRDHFCQFCEISFGNEVMYTLHMGQHGYEDPFKCNLCGHKSENGLAFFLHMTRAKH